MSWKVATLRESSNVAENVKSLIFHVDGLARHIPGQHFDIRLTAPNGYMAQRSYSAANLPNDEGFVEFGVQILEDGEVSPYLWGLKVEQQVEVLGPIGGHFVYDPVQADKEGADTILIAGGSGVVPFISMLRAYTAWSDSRQSTGSANSGNSVKSRIKLVLSARTYDKLPYREYLESLRRIHGEIDVSFTLTDAAPEDWTQGRGRINADMLGRVFEGVKNPQVFICGPTGFVEAMAGIVVNLDVSAERVKTERFGG